MEAALKELDATIHVEYLLLRDADLRMCKGCYQCLAHGQDKCPLKDDQKAIEEKMLKKKPGLAWFL